MLEFSCVLITGASSGLGEAFARALAPRSRKLILVARREDRLMMVRAELVAAHPGLEAVIVCRVDLADPIDRARFLHGHADAIGEVDLLINNAGMGDYGEFANADWTKTAGMIELNVAAVTHLAHAVLPGMRGRRQGGIINVSSLAGEVFMPDLSVYAASKAYVTRWSEALGIEVRGEGIAVVAVCPGPVATGFGAVAQRDGEKKGDLPMVRWIATSPEKVVAVALVALESGKIQVFPGFGVRALAAAIHVLPKSLQRLILSRRPRQGRPIP